MRAARLIFAAWVVLSPVGCQVWRVSPVTPLATTEIEGNPKLVRLTLADGRIVRLQSPTIDKDSIYGLIAESHGDRIAFPLTDVRQLDKRLMSPARTAALVIGIAAAAFVTFFSFVLLSLKEFD